MLDDKICKMRDKLNESIATGQDYEKIYQLSVELDELIAQYYRNKKRQASKNEEGTKERIKAI